METGISSPILVTGSHSSGTTWVGRMIASVPGMAYLHEPFNKDFDRDICKVKFPHWFMYVCEENENEYASSIRDMLEFRPKFIQGLASSRSAKQAAKQVRTLWQFTQFRMLASRPLVKDPIAIFSVDWLVKRFGMIPVILIRHPAAFAGSLKRNQWDHPFRDFLEQPLLLRDHLHPFLSEIEKFAAKRHEIVEQAALLWKIIYHVVSSYQKEHPEWLFVRHEDLSLDPVTGFKSIFQRTGIPFSEETEMAIKSFSGGAPKPPAGARKFPRLQRNSVENIKSWKDRLTPGEISQVRDRVGGVSSLFYSETDW